jgi:hypothetical protein
MHPIPQSVAKRVVFKAFLGDGVTPATGKTLPITLSQNAGAFANPSAGATNATEIAKGWYYVDLSTTDTGTLGPLIVAWAATGVDGSEVVFSVVNAHNAGFDGTLNATIAGDAYTRIGAAGAGLTALGDTRIANLDTTVSSRTKPADTQAAVTTVTNLTNAPTAGDFTAAMKTSLNAATPTGGDTAGVTTLLTRITGVVPTNPLLTTDARLNDLDATISSRLAAGSYTAPDNAGIANAEAGIALIKAKTDNLPASPAAVGDIPTAIQNADALLDLPDAIETGLTLRQAHRLEAAAAAGKLSGAATTTVTIRNAVADDTDRIQATVDSDGNRTAVATDVS